MDLNAEKSQKTHKFLDHVPNVLWTKHYGTVYLPYALKKKYTNANREWIWQYVFESAKLSIGPRWNVNQRNHLDEAAVHRAVKKQYERQTFANMQAAIHYGTHLLESSYDIRIARELLDHEDINTTMIYTHVLKKSVLGMRSLADMMENNNSPHISNINNSLPPELQKKFDNIDLETINCLVLRD
jgi:integrase